MKKWIFAFISLAFIGIVLLYALVPSNIAISASTSVNTSPAAAIRVLSDDSAWTKWWPGTVDGSGLHFNGASYILSKKMFQSFSVDIATRQSKTESLLVLLPLKRDSFEIEWKLSVGTGLNPIDRFRRSREANNKKKDLDQLLTAFRKYVEDSKNIYGSKIIETHVQDSIILVSTIKTTAYPSPKLIYQEISKLKKAAASAGAKETNKPMLNVHQEGNLYMARVGLPIGKEIAVEGSNLSIKRMVLGYILVSEIQGGPATVSRTMSMMELYMADNKRKSPAIPYESLVTDRSAESDSSKWITRIYYPVY